MAMLHFDPHTCDCTPFYQQGDHTMRMHPKNSDTANTFSTSVLNKNDSCKAIRIDLNLISFCKEDTLTSSFDIPNDLTQVFLYPLYAILILDSAYTRKC
jgi:hypothetical protein